MRLVRFTVDRDRGTAVVVRVLLNRPEQALLAAAIWCRWAPQTLAENTLGRLACRWLNRHNALCRGRNDCYQRGGTWPATWI